MIATTNTSAQAPIIKIIGIGGGGCRAVQQMIEQGIEGVQFICIDSDINNLNKLSAQPSILIHKPNMNDFNVRAPVQVRRQPVVEDCDKISTAIASSDLLFIVAGMGGTTGTSMAPVVAQLAKEVGVLTIALVTKPLKYESTQLMQFATQGLKRLLKFCDSLTCIPYESLIIKRKNKLLLQNIFNKAYNKLNTAFKQTTDLLPHPKLSAEGFSYLKENAFKDIATPSLQFHPAIGSADKKIIPFHHPFDPINDIIRIIIQDISEMIMTGGLICFDFADVRSVIHSSGLAAISYAEAQGENRAIDATLAALTSPLLNDIEFADAKGIVATVTGGLDLRIKDLDDVGSMLGNKFPNIDLLSIGTNIDSEFQDRKLRVSLLITGIKEAI